MLVLASASRCCCAHAAVALSGPSANGAPCAAHRVCWPGGSAAWPRKGLPEKKSHAAKSEACLRLTPPKAPGGPVRCRPAAEPLERCKAGREGPEVEGHGAGDPAGRNGPREEGVEVGPTSARLPTAHDALSWFCISLILLISLTDFTPVGPALQSASDQAPLLLAGLQWVFFVGPTVSWARDCGFDLKETFRLRPCTPKDLALGTLGGLGSWALVGGLLSLKAGLSPSADAADVALSPLVGSLAEGGTGWAVLWYAVSPAAAEELLFRGFALTALSASFGRVDSVMLAAAMFGVFHLSVPQLFPTMVLGIAAGFATLASGSVFPAMALHFTNNAAALLLGGLAPVNPIGS